jgi:hypothetical protein
MRTLMRFSSTNTAGRARSSTKRTSRFLAPVSAVLLAALAGPFLSTASADTSAGCSRTLVCTVIEPNVHAKQTEYPTIEFKAGDHVRIEAGGCVQTGGHGNTWKRYVDPAADNDLYHGLISIPGVFDQVRLQGVVNTTVTVPQDGDLILGYEDDGYSDNGYYAHDDGTGDQCRNVGAAWVRLTIT